MKSHFIYIFSGVKFDINAKQQKKADSCPSDSIPSAAEERRNGEKTASTKVRPKIIFIWSERKFAEIAIPNQS